jgi:hypothetical protein
MEISPHVEICSKSWKSQYSYSILQFVSKNRKYFITNYDTLNLQTRQSNNLFPPTSDLTLYQKGVYFTGIKLFNKLPSEIKETILTLNLFSKKLLSSIALMNWRNVYTVNE